MNYLYYLLQKHIFDVYFTCIQVIKDRQTSFHFWTEHVAEIMKKSEEFNKFLKNNISKFFSLLAPYLRYFDRKLSDEETMKMLTQKIDIHGFGQKFLNPAVGSNHDHRDWKDEKRYKQMIERWRVLRNNHAHRKPGARVTDWTIDIVDFIAFVLMFSYFWCSMPVTFERTQASYYDNNDTLSMSNRANLECDFMDND